MAKWISIEDRLPRKCGEYLCIVYGLDKRPHIYVLYYANERGFYDYDGEYGYYDVDASYWMPLPEPPKEINKNDG